MRPLEAQLIDRLSVHPLPGTEEEDILIAALVGDAELEEALGGTSPARPATPAAGPDGTAARTPAGAYLKSVTVSGFRGIGPPATLELSPGPGLTVVCGRNGSGKSSFAEALEVLLTGSIRRLEGRSAVWRSSWRCLHGGTSEVSAELYLESSNGPTRVTRSWGDGDKGYADGSSIVGVPGEPAAGLDRLGWGDALSLYRPFLSHAELEVLLWEPSKLYDQLNNLLGLEELNEIAGRLGDARKRADSAPAAAKAQLVAVKELVAGTESDERATRAAALLEKRQPDLDALEALAAGAGDHDSTALGLLSRLAATTVPAPGDVAGAAAALDDAARILDDIGTSAAGDAAATARLLEEAIDHFRRHGPGPCPVCARPDALDDTWMAETSDQVRRLHTSARDLERARDQAQGSLRQAALLIGPPPPELDHAGDVGIDASELAAAWQHWTAVPVTAADSPSTLRDLSAHLADRHPGLHTAAADLRARAAAELERRQDRWAPVATALSAWVAAERAAQQARLAAGRIKRVETWLKAANDDLRNERLRPFAEGTASLWSQLRQESNVDLVKMVLTGTNTSRAVDIQVTVDGQPAPGPGVMSQGEINALGLSIFLPRATSDDSPLRFVVIDDPVQAMDPSKVDGMARVLSEVAKDRQVVVFTHDDRLPDALRHLDLPADIIEVTRRPGSVVELRKAWDPARSLLDDAWRLAAGQDIPAAVAGRVIPGLCREAVEEVCFETTRRRRLAAGARHDTVEEILSGTVKLLPRLALAIYDDPARGGEVYTWLNTKIARWAGDLASELNKGSHGDSTLDPKNLVRDTEKLVERLRSALQ